MKDIKKMPMRKDLVYVSLRERKKKRQGNTLYGIVAIALLFIISINFLGGGQTSHLTITELGTQPLNFRPMESVRRWHGVGQQVAYLTFNAGPSQNTGAILEILAKEEVAATFFVLGDHINSHEEPAPVLNQILDEGHYIGLFSMTRLGWLLYDQVTGPQAFMEEMEAVQQLVYDATGHWTNLVRPPYGSLFNFSDGHIDAILESDFSVWDWHADSRDWSAGVNTEQILGYLEADMNSWGWPDDAVILLNENDITVASLPSVIAFFREHGYRFRAYDPQNHFPMNRLHRLDL